MRVNIPLVGQSNTAKAVRLNPQTRINLFPVLATDDSGIQYPSALYGTPGSNTLYASLSAGGVRPKSLYELNGVLYAVGGNTFYKIETGGVVTSLGTLLTASGPLNIISNGFQLMISDGIAGYVYDLNAATFTQINDLDFGNPDYLTYQSGRAIYSAGDNFYISALNDFTTYDASDTAQAESDPQNLVAPFACSGFLFLFGQQNTEVWGLTGNGLFPYEKISGQLIPYGCVAKHTIVDVSGVPVWLAKDKAGTGLIMTLQGFQPKILVSDHDTALLQSLTTISDAYAYTMQIMGHIWYVITFPTEQKTFVYDFSTGAFFRWASWQSLTYGTYTEYNLGQHISNSFAFFDSKLLIGDYRGTGRILQLSLDSYQDYSTGSDNSIYREVTTQLINNNKKRITCASIELEVESGTSTVTSLDTSSNQPLLSLAFSRDGGKTFDNPRSVSLGLAGEYKKRSKLNAFGQFIDGAVKLYTNHPSFIALFNLVVEAIVSEYHYYAKVK